MPENKTYTGLTQAQVTESRRLNGSNILTPPKKKPAFLLFLAKFNDPLIIILLIAGALSVGISFYEYYALGQNSSVFIEPVGIFIAIFLATGLGFIFEYRAEKEFALLNQVSDSEPVQVVRDGKHVMIPRSDVVKGDIVVIETGDEVPADGHLLEATSLSIDESTLTGEPIAHKSAGPVTGESHATYAPDQVLRGTKVMEGHGVMEVTSVGDHTESGKVFKAVGIDRSVKTPLSIQLNRLGHLVSVASYIIGTLVVLGRVVMYFSENGFQSVDWMEFGTYFLQSLMLAVTLVVVAVPEGLPMAVTLALAYSMRRMLHTGNLVRKLHACETMGAVTVICTDKTGTLTENRMTVKEEYLGKISTDMKSLLFREIAVNTTANINNAKADSKEKPEAVGNPTECALLIWESAQLPADESVASLRNVRVESQLPFSTERKYMATAFEWNGRSILAVKGAPEILLSRSTTFANGLEPEKVREQLRACQEKAMRTIAFADAESETSFTDESMKETPLRFLGFVAIADPVRADVPPAIDEVRRAGIKVKIVTGDTPATAREIGRQIGLWDDSDTDSAITTGADIEAMSDDELAKRVGGLKIIARARPMDKKRLVEALQRNGEVVAVTGDGTNDAPALKAAHVGLSMGDGTAVAKEASDITIVHNSFAGIGNAVVWGRSLYRNIQRFILFQLTVNVAACLTVLAGAFMGTQAPLTVTQMLWVNLVMDTFAAMALASLPPSRDVLKLPPRPRNAFIITRQMSEFILGVGLLFAVVMIGMLYVLEHASVNHFSQLFDPVLSAYKGLSPVEHSLFFTFFVMLQMWNIFNARAFGSHRSAFHLRHCGEFMLIVGIIFVGQVLITTFGREFFDVSPLSLTDWLWILGVSSTVLLGGEAIRAFEKA